MSDVKTHPYSIPGIKFNSELEALEACGLSPVRKLNVRSRKGDIKVQRQLYMYYLVKLFGWSSVKAAALFDRDHATALHALKTLSNWRDTDKAFLLRMRKIEVKFDNEYHSNMNYKEYFVIEKQLNNKGFDCSRSELIDLFTEGRTDSLRALKTHEYIEFLDWLKKQFNLSRGSKSINNPANRMRQKLWALFVKKMSYKEADYYAWVQKYGKFHKPIDEHTAAELVQLVTQAELVYKSWLKEVKKVG